MKKKGGSKNKPKKGLYDKSYCHWMPEHTIPFMDMLYSYITTLTYRNVSYCWCLPNYQGPQHRHNLAITYDDFKKYINSFNFLYFLHASNIHYSNIKQAKNLIYSLIEQYNPLLIFLPFYVLFTALHLLPVFSSNLSWCQRTTPTSGVHCHHHRWRGTWLCNAHVQ